MKISEIIVEIISEVERSNIKHRPEFVTTSEWLGVVREEYLEWEQEIVKQKGQYSASNRIKAEAIQVAAMMVKGILSLCHKEDPEQE